MKTGNNLRPLRAVLVYTIFGVLWILISDQVLNIVFHSDPNYVLMQTLKGWLFVAASACLLYFVLRYEMQALGESEEKFKYIFDYSIVGKSITDPDGGITVNKAFCDMLGYTKGELMGEKWREITHPDDIEPSNRAIQPLLDGEKDSTRLTKRYIHKNGAVVWVDLNTSLRRSTEGKPLYFITSVLDITERKQAELKLQESETRYRSLFEHMISGYAYCQMLFEAGKPHDFIYIDVNDAFEKLTGLKDVDGKKVSEVIPGIRESNHELFETYGRVALTGIPERLETYIEALETWFLISVYSPKKEFFVAVFDNITERKQAEKTISNLARFPEENPSPIMRVTLDGKIIYANLPSQPLLHQWNSAVESFLPADWKWVVSDAYATNRKQMIDVYCQDRIYSILVAPIQEAGYVNLYGRDITERKQVEEALSESERNYRKIIETAGEGVWVIDADNRTTFVNNRLCNMLGYTPEEMMGESVYAFMDAESQALAAASLERRRQGINEQLDFRYKRKDGSDLWALIETSTLLDREGKYIGALAMLTNITERKQAEERLQASERTLTLFVEHAPASIAMFDRDMKYIAVSRRFLADYNLPDQSIVGHCHYDVFPEVPERWKEIHKRCLAGATEKAEEDPFPRADGSMDWVRWEIHPWHEPSGVVGGIILFSEVITQRKQTLEVVREYSNQLEQKVKDRTAELNHTNAELERANRTKDEFLANMSHELRTPLNSILGLSESLLEQRRGTLNGSQQISLQIIESSGRHLLELISDILDLSKIEAGKFDYYPQNIYVDEVCRASLSFVKSQAARKSITVNYTNEAAVPEITADPRRLKQILVNLLTNAVKFTPDHGQVTLEICTDSEQELIRLSVIDTGIGIAPEDLKRLFVPFVQVDSSITREFEGTGLGLALVQKLTDLHGGSIQVESEIGKGSRFTVNLYCNLNGPEQLKEVDTDNLRPIDTQETTVNSQLEGKVSATTRYKILLADDNEANILTVGEYLESYGYEVLVAHDGLEAVEKAETGAPEVILMDIQMPVMGGLEAMGRLRADPGFASTPIIALTALAMVGDRERCIEAGATEYMSKPASLKTLRKMIESFLAEKK